MEEFKGFNHNIPDDIETVFDICDKEHYVYAQEITYRKNRKDYLDFIKANYRPIDMIYKHIMIYYKKIKNDEEKANFYFNKINPFYLAKP
ncbi:MAG: hypothetical protein II707_04730 [Spirochaetales bacterium]|nr:hypothetical protein [Spirochaetales bacterium]